MSISAMHNASAERLTAVCVLSVIGGFLDIYTYLCRGHVFANAVTGNMVLFGLNLAGGQWDRCAKYFLPILAYGAGVFMAELIHRQLPVSRKIGWHQFTLMLEVAGLAVIVFIPFGDFDFAVNSVISFVCALQVQTFRRVRGLPFASTMCTGNLRSGTEALFRHFNEKDRAELYKAMHYYGVIVCFIAGAAAGAFLLHRFGHFVFLLAPVGLSAAFFMLTTKWQWAAIRRTFRRKRRT